MKSSRSIHSLPVKGTFRVPAEPSSGLLAASRHSVRPSGQFSITTSSGCSTAIRRGASRLWWSRPNASSSSISWTPSTRSTPMCSQKARMASGGYPRRRSPFRVGMRGSSHPSTLPSSTSEASTRLEVTVWVRFRRANSYWRGWSPGSRSRSRNQSYSGRWTSNSRLHSEWVTPSTASLWPWAQS